MRRRSPARARALAPDPVTRAIIRGALRAAQTQMEAVIERTAMSPFIREKNDYFAGILDARGRVVCGTMVPLFGNLTQTREWRDELAKRLWVGTYMNSGETRAYLQSQSRELAKVLTGLGLVK